MPGVLRSVWQQLVGACGFDRTNNGYRAPDVEAEGTEFALRTHDASVDLAMGTHDAAAGTGVVRNGITGYNDPSVLPAATSANGDDTRQTGSRQGEAYVYPSRVSGGEDIANKTQVVEERWALGSGGILAATGTLHNAACRLACVVLAETGGVQPYTATIRDGGGGGTQIVPTIYVPGGQSRELWFALPIVTDVHVTVAGAGTPSMAAYRHVGGP